MKFFFATVTSNDKNKNLIKVGVKNRLISYFYLKQHLSILEFLEHFSTKGYDTRKIINRTKMSLEKVNAYSSKIEQLDKIKQPKKEQNEEIQLKRRKFQKSSEPFKKIEIFIKP